MFKFFSKNHNKYIIVFLAFGFLMVGGITNNIQANQEDLLKKTTETLHKNVEQELEKTENNNEGVEEEKVEDNNAPVRALRNLGIKWNERMEEIRRKRAERRQRRANREKTNQENIL